MNSKTAILIFSRSSAAEAAGKKILRNKKQNLKAVSGLIKNTLKTVSSCNLPTYISDETSQTGNSFGEKLANAISETFAKGNEKIIVLGNDCPQLNKQMLKNAVEQLSKQDWVLGPSPKGGVYLMGISATSFDRKSFEKIHWQTDLVFESLVENLKEANTGYATLRRMSEVNFEFDIQLFTNQSQFNSLIRLLINLLISNLFKFSKQPPQIIYIYSTEVNYRRGPPFSI